jgi:hypothetical protein
MVWGLVIGCAEPKIGSPFGELRHLLRSFHVIPVGDIPSGPSELAQVDDGTLGYSIYMRVMRTTMRAALIWLTSARDAAITERFSPPLVDAKGSPCARTF